MLTFWVRETGKGARHTVLANRDPANDGGVWDDIAIESDFIRRKTGWSQMEWWGWVEDEYDMLVLHRTNSGHVYKHGLEDPCNWTGSPTGSPRHCLVTDGE